MSDLMQANIKIKSSGAAATVNTFKSSFKKIIAAGAALYALRGAFNFIGDSIKEALEYKRVLMKVKQIIKSTGGAAGVTATEMEALANKMQILTGVTNTEIIKAESIMLTFTQIGKEVLPDAMMALANMAEVTGGDMVGAATRLGIALNNPITGATRLARNGVILTETQKESIKTFMEQNDIVSAQKVLLDELQVEYGGVAEAIGNSLPGKIDKATAAWADFKRLLGESIIETNTFGDTLDSVTKVSESSALSQTADWKLFLTGLIDGFTSLTTVIVAAFKIAWDVIDLFYKTIMNAWVVVFSGISDFIKNLVSVTKAGFTTMITSIKIGMMEMLDWVSSHTGVMGEKMLSTFGLTAEGIKIQIEDIRKVNLEARTEFSKSWDWSGVNLTSGHLVEEIKLSFGTIGRDIDAIKIAATDLFTGINYEPVVDEIISGNDEIVNSSDNTTREITKNLNTIEKAHTKVGRSIENRFYKVIKNIDETVIAGVSGIANKVLEDTSSPVNAFTIGERVGASFMQGLQSISNKSSNKEVKETIWAFVKSLMKIAMNQIIGMLSGGGLVGGIVSSLIGGIGSMFGFSTGGGDQQVAVVNNINTLDVQSFREYNYSYNQQAELQSWL